MLVAVKNNVRTGGRLLPNRKNSWQIEEKRLGALGKAPLDGATVEILQPGEAPAFAGKTGYYLLTRSERQGEGIFEIVSEARDGRGEGENRVPRGGRGVSGRRQTGLPCSSCSRRAFTASPPAP